MMTSSKLKEWYDWISAKPCVGQGCKAWPVEVSHIGLLFSNKTGGRLPRRVGGNKWAVIPLCVKCHREGERSIHNIGESKWTEENELQHPRLLMIWASWLAGFLEGEAP